MLGGTSNRGTVPLVAAPPGPPPSPSSAGSRSSGTWRLLILDTSLQIVAASSKRQCVVAMDVSRDTRRPVITGFRASAKLRASDFTRTSQTSQIHVFVKTALVRICTHDFVTSRPSLSSAGTKASSVTYRAHVCDVYRRGVKSCGLSTKQRVAKLQRVTLFQRIDDEDRREREIVRRGS